MYKHVVLHTDILIIGGGAAGCYAALTAGSYPTVKVLLAEKANIKRSGCLAAGVNALNAYINPGESPESYVDYVRDDSEGLLREDLVLSIAQNLNRVTRQIEQLGLTILKDSDGKYVPRGKRSIKINGENIKPLLAEAVGKLPNVTVHNRLNIIDYLLDEGKVIGAFGFSLDEETFYTICSKATICTTGGAAGLYKPNNPGFSRHKMWYSPFNTGAGYAMGIRAGAEMTGFEMRFIALRCKDTIAPTGTVAQGVKTPQINASGTKYVGNYGKPTTPMRLYATVKENQAGRGPCYLQTKGITPEQEEELFKAYLNMAPAQTLQWLERSVGPREQNIEIEGTEPYIVGGHTASGYWVDSKRATTLKGLYAAGDVAGGSPKKYVSGCFAEAEIAVLAALDYIKDPVGSFPNNVVSKTYLQNINSLLRPVDNSVNVEQLEEEMQKVMDEHAGGISTGYSFNTHSLQLAEIRIQELKQLASLLSARNSRELLKIFELIDRLDVCEVLIAHLQARRETRWPCYQSNNDYPQRDDQNWLKFVNSRKHGDTVQIILRELVVKGGSYEHQN